MTPAEMQHIITEAMALIERQRDQITHLEAERDWYKRHLGKRVLLDDLRRDLEELRLAADTQPPALLRRQAE